LLAVKRANKNQLKIIGGEWRGRKLEFCDAEGLRPTGARIRETLFNWLQHDVEGMKCLDLFAGSGALAFEASSRGAARVVMVEKNPVTGQSLREQMEQFQVNNIELWQGSALDFLQENCSLFDLVLLDPPFTTSLLEQTLEALVSGKHLSADALCYFEFPRREIPALPHHWHFIRQKQAGDVGYGLVSTG
jgi:16S rRNA (guanine966-N2)-methyltransferase